MVHSTPNATADVPVPRYFNHRLEGRNSLTRERIRQIETIAMRKFRRELVKRGLCQSDVL